MLHRTAATRLRPASRDAAVAPLRPAPRGLRFRPLMAAVPSPSSPEARVDPSAARQKLALAAEQLAKAAVEHSSSAYVGLCNQALAELRSIATSAQATATAVERMEQSTSQSSSDTAEQLEILQAQVHVVESLVLSKVHDSGKQARTQQLQWAMGHACVGKFQCKDTADPRSPRSSKRLAENVLSAWLRGEGAWIPDNYLVPDPKLDPQLVVDLLVAAAGSKDPITVNSLVVAVPGSGCSLPEGRVGIIVQDDMSSVPYLVKDLETGHMRWCNAVMVKRVPVVWARSMLGMDTGKERFRIKLAEQVHGLTGMRPRVVLERNSDGAMQHRMYRQ